MRTVFITVLLIFVDIQCPAFYLAETYEPALPQNERTSSKAVSKVGQSKSKFSDSPLTLNATGKDSSDRNSTINSVPADKSISNYFSFQISPDQRKIYITGGEHSFTRIEVVNAAGNIILFSNDKNSETLLDMSKVSKGNYAIKIFTENGMVTKTFTRK